MALAPFIGGKDCKLHTSQVAKKLIAAYGQLGTSDLGKTHAGLINTWLAHYENNFSKHRRAGAARRVFRYLWEEYDAAPLHRRILVVAKPKPRNVTATKQERSNIIEAAPLHLRCWLLMCSDLAIRSGTAATLGPSHYDAHEGVLTFRTKYQNAQRIPVTNALRQLLDTCTEPGLPFVAQLTRGSNRLRNGKPLCARGRAINYHSLLGGFNRLKKQVGITRKLTPHDLRRTTARDVYTITKDLRTVQALLGHSDLGATMWYLQDSLTTVPVAALELAKLNPTTEVIQ